MPRIDAIGQYWIKSFSKNNQPITVTCP